MDNIQQLREKVEKDPKSTVFVRLAEELKKAGQLDEAIEVLKSGIEHQPGYMSARVALGKVYMDKGMSDEAKAEFMQVVEAVPDNLFARKKLAELYRDEGDIELALDHYKQYLILSPQDEEAHAVYEELKSAPIPEAKAPEAKPKKEEFVEPGKRPSPLMEAMEQPEQAPRPAAGPPAEAAPAEAGDLDAEDVYLESAPYGEVETEGFLSTLSEDEADLGGESSDEMSLSLQEKSEVGAGHGVEFRGFDLESDGTPSMGQNDIDSMIEDTVGVPGGASQAEAAHLEEAAGAEEEEQVGVFELSEEEAGMGLELGGVPMEEDEAGVGVVEIPEEEPTAELEPFTGSEPGEAAAPMAEAEAPPAEPAGEAAPAVNIEERFAEADALVEREEYVKALEIYRRLLTSEGDNPEVHQRAEELRGLIKLLGKDHEIVEARLLAFLESLKRKKHEFFGSS